MSRAGIRAVWLVIVALTLASFVQAAGTQEQTPTWPREPEAPSAPRPAPPPADWLGLIGEYESAAGPSGSTVRLYVIERDGRLMTIADRGEGVAIDAMTPKPALTRGPGGRATRVVLGGVTYARLRVGPEDGSGQLRVTRYAPSPKS